MVYGLCRDLPGDRAFCHRHQRKLLPANLTPASRRQDHTTSPSASKRSRQKRCPRPPHPIPTFVTMANAPLREDRTAGSSAVICNFCKSEYFCKGGLTGHRQTAPLICLTGRPKPKQHDRKRACSGLRDVLLAAWHWSRTRTHSHVAKFGLIRV